MPFRFPHPIGGGPLSNEVPTMEPGLVLPPAAEWATVPQSGSPGIWGSMFHHPVV